MRRHIVYTFRIKLRQLMTEKFEIKHKGRATENDFLEYSKGNLSKIERQVEYKLDRITTAFEVPNAFSLIQYSGASKSNFNANRMRRIFSIYYSIYLPWRPYLFTTIVLRHENCVKYNTYAKQTDHFPPQILTDSVARIAASEFCWIFFFFQWRRSIEGEMVSERFALYPPTIFLRFVVAQWDNCF